ncbi:hypothetical protein ACFSL4_10960 [Streptomyces caeni]|uniref:DUF2946 domain-containing protein n=1 Tax=Streptomyces caeni TaxID=2307231 RepID=A0ABW4IPT3_9ACTN
MGVSWAVRSVRAAVFSVVCVLLAAGGHALATGAVPQVWVDAAASLPVFAAAVALAGRECSLRAIAAAMLTVQGALHLAFAAAGPSHVPMRMPGMSHAMHMACAPCVTASHVVAAHLAAALLASWCLRRGEAALWSLLRKAVTFVPGLVAWWRRTAPPPVCVGASRPHGRRRHPLGQALPRHALTRRGPPPVAPYAI